LNFVGRPVVLGATGVFEGVVLPWACLVAFGVLAGLLVAFLMVSGITRNPHVNERMTTVYSIRFHFASVGVGGWRWSPAFIKLSGPLRSAQSEVEG